MIRNTIAENVNAILIDCTNSCVIWKLITMRIRKNFKNLNAHIACNAFQIKVFWVCVNIEVHLVKSIGSVKSLFSSLFTAKHLRQQCENKTKTAVCLMCNNRFTWKSNLEKHVSIYHQADSKYMANNQNQVVRPHKCEQCVKSFYRPEQLEAHKSTHMPRPKKFTCDICKKRFSRTDNLK